MATSDKELELQLSESGNRLSDPPASVHDLINILDQIENCLSRVEQSPSEAMQKAINPSLKALVSDYLFRHPDDDVKVAVAACISEITRITAPDAPYEDEQMKEVFQLIVSSFENLSDKSSRSFSKRTAILDTVAKVRSCVLMLDLECDLLIIEMFQHFLKAIRDYHEDSVFSSMVTIMNLVLEESEDIPTELLSPILACLKKDNEEVLPVARRLAERVLESCASKLKPYLTQAVQNLGISFDDYSSVVSSICQAQSAAVEQNDADTDKHVDDESKPAEAPLDEAAQEDKEMPKEAGLTEQADLANDKSPKPVVSNGVVQTSEDSSLADLKSSKKQEDDQLADKSKSTDNQLADESKSIDNQLADESKNTDNQLADESKSTDNQLADESKSTDNQLADESKSTDDQLADESKHTDKQHADESKSIDIPSVAEPDKEEAEEVVHPDSKLEQSNQEEKGVESDSKSTEPSNISHADGKEAETLLDPKNEVKDDAGSPQKDPSVSGAVSSEKKKEADVQRSSPKATENESTDVTSPTPSGTLPDESQSKKAARAKKKESLNKEATPSVDNVSKKASEGTSDSEAKSNKLTGKKVSAVVSSEDNGPADVDETKTESGTASESEAKSQKKPSKKVDSSTNADGSSSKQLDDKKRRARGKLVSLKDATKTSTKNDDEGGVASPKSVKPNKDDSHMEETPKTNSKRKHTLMKEKASGILEYGENLVGSKVKVWWPKDRAFYDGVIDSFDSVKKKHKVLYNDGDEEILNLRREKWEFIDDESESDEEVAADHPSPDGSPEMPQKKKAKAADPPNKKVKMDASPKRVGGASSGKSKGAATKSGRKTKEDSKVDGKSKDGSKSASKSENDTVSKAKDHTSKSGGKSVEGAPKAGSKSKNEDSGEPPKSNKSKDDGGATPKASTKTKPETSKTPKTKQETPKVSSNSKGKPLKSGGKSNANGTGKSKSGSSKVKESESTKENSSDSAKVLESMKRKSPSSSKAQGSDSKSAKKRRR